MNTKPQSMTATHTPLPWRTAIIDNRTVIRSCEAAPVTVAIAYTENPHLVTEEQRQANAALIVRAVNRDHAFEQLLSVLKAAEKWAMLTQTDSVPWLEQATDAIKSAEPFTQ